MARRILDFLDMPRYKMCYFFSMYNMKQGVSKSEIARAFGYSSDGHFYPDFNYLFKEGIIIERDRRYQLGREGKKEFRHITMPMISLSFSIGFSFIFIYFYIRTLTGMQITPIVFLFMSAIQILNASLCLLTLRTFTPRLPSEVNTLKDRGWIGRILNMFSKE